MTIEMIIHYVNTHSKSFFLKFVLVLVPTGFFVFTDCQLLMMQSLFWIIAMDTILGTLLAIKLKVFSSIGMGRFVKKIIPYGVVLLTVHLADLALVTGNDLLFISGSYLILRETISNLEKGFMLNVPIPKKLMNLLGMEVEDVEKMKKEWKKRGKK